MKRQINSLKEIDLETVTAEDLRWKYGTHTTESKGKGREKVTTSRSGVMTPIGDMKLSVWVEAAKAVIHRDGLDEELERMSGYNFRGKVKVSFKEILYHRSLSGVLSSLYKNPAWVGFIEYNKQYHPELLTTASLVQVYTDCCGAPCTFTKAWLERDINRTTCPQCGQRSSIHLNKEDASGGEGV